MSSKEEEVCDISGVERDKTIKTLANTLTNLYSTDLKELNGKLTEFRDKQVQLSKEIELEKEVFAKDKNWKDTEEFMAGIQIYKDKLVAIKKEMTSIHNRTKALKRKATEIQDFKLKQQNQQ